MSKAKVLAASCSASSVVTAEGVTVTPVTILSMGKQASTGFLIMDGEQAYYVASNALDIKTVIEKLVTVIEKSADALTQASNGLIAAGGALDGIAGGSGTSTTAAGNAITPLITQLNTVKSELNTLKGALK